MSTLTELEVNLYTKKQTRPSDDAPSQDVPTKDIPTQDIPDTGDTGVVTVEATPTNINTNNNNISIVFFAGFCVSLILALLAPKIYKALNKNRRGYYHLRKSPNFAKLQLASLTLAAISLGAGVITTAKAINTDTDENIEASSKLTIDAGILNTNNIAIIHDTITVPATENGFSLYVTSDLTDLVDIHNPAHTIKTLTTKGKLQDNTYGIYIGKEAPTADSEFLPIYSSSATRTSIFSTEIGATSIQEIDVWYGVRSSNNVDSTYKTIVEYTANSTRTLTMQEMTEDVCRSIDVGIMDERLIDSRDGKAYTIGKYADGNCWMTQNLDLDLSTELTLTSEDTDLPEGETWTPTANTDTESNEWDFPIFTEEDLEKIPAGNELPDKNNYCLYYDKTEDEMIIGNLQKCGENSFDSGIEKDGNYYSAEAATAGTARKEEMKIYDEEEKETETIEKITATASICPANWHIATESEWTNMISQYINLESINEGNSVYYGKEAVEGEYDLNKQVPSLDPAGGYTGNVNIIKKLFDIEKLDNKVYKTYEFEGTKVKINIFTAGLFQEYVNNIEEGSYTMMMTESFFMNVEEFIPAFGSSVRCVANYKNYSLDFDANLEKDNVTIENFPESIQTAITKENRGTGITYTFPTTAPTRSDGIEFLGWATNSDNIANGDYSYIPGEQVEIKGSTTKFYAVWDTENVLKYPYAIRTENDDLIFTYTTQRLKVDRIYEQEDGTQSRIKELFNIPLDKECPVFEDTEEYMQDCVPEWASNTASDEEMIFYSSIHIEKNMSEFEPVSTAFWFAGMKGAQTISGMENLNTEKVTSMAGMFYMNYPDTSDKSAESFPYTGRVLDLRNFDTSHVKDMTYMFGASIYGKVLGIEDFNTSQVESMASMFGFTVTWPVHDIDFSKWDTSKVKNFEAMFITSFAPKESLDEGFTDDLGIRISGIENWDTSNSISFEDMFAWSGLTYETLDLTHWDTSNVTDMQGMFALVINAGEKPLKTIDLSGWDTNRVTSMRNMFNSTGVTVDDSGNTLETIILSKKQNPETGEVIGWNISSVQSVEKMFNALENLKTIYVSEDWTSNSLIRNETKMFGSNDNLVGGSGTKYSDRQKSGAFAAIDKAVYDESGNYVSGTKGYFTNACVYYGNCVATSPTPTQTSTPTQTYSYTPSTETPVAEEQEETPVSTSSEKKEAKKSETEQEQTNPLGVEKSVGESSTVDTATVAVIVASFVLVSAGAVIIFMIERKRSREDGEY